MDGDTASKFVSSLVKSIQALCNGYIDFSSSIEVIGHIHLRIDQNQKFNYVLSEEVSKSKSEAATVFASHSYHSQPPPSITPGDGRSPSQTDSPSRHRRKSQQVPRVDESDSLTVSALQPDVPSVSKEKTLRRVSNSGDSPHSGTISDTDLARGVKKHENGNRVGKQVTSTQDSLDRRRKLQTESRPHDSAAKRSRPSGGSAANTGYEVIEIKEEPDDCSDYFGDDSAAGQDISQPDFSNLVAESLDRVGQMEGSSLLSGQHDQPFPVMLHANQSSSTTGLPGTSDQGAVASSSGGEEDVVKRAKTKAKKDAEESVDATKLLSVTSAYREYTPEDMEEAIEFVHGGMPVIDAALKFNIPRASLFVRSRQGCKTHTGRCSTVFARNHQEEAAAARKGRPKSQYSREAVEEAIEAVHNGVPVIDAAIQFGIPRATLFARSGKGCPTHEGRCSTVFSDGQLRRTSKKKFQICFE